MFLLLLQQVAHLPASILHGVALHWSVTYIIYLFIISSLHQGKCPEVVTVLFPAVSPTAPEKEQTLNNYSLIRRMSELHSPVQGMARTGRCPCFCFLLHLCSSLFRTRLCSLLFHTLPESFPPWPASSVRRPPHARSHFGVTPATLHCKCCCLCLSHPHVSHPPTRLGDP